MKYCFSIGITVPFLIYGSVIPFKYTRQPSIKEFVLHVGNGLD